MTVEAHGATEPRPGAVGGEPALAPILAVHLAGTLGFSIALPFLVFLVTNLGGAPWTYGLVGATYSAAQLVGAPLLGRWSDKSGRRPVLVLSQAGTLVAWLVFLLALQLPARPLAGFAGATLTVPLLLVFAARMLDGLTGGNVSVANAYVADVTRDDKEARQRAFGRMGMAASLGFTIGPALAGLLSPLGDGYTAPVVAAVLLSAAGTVLCLGLREPEGRCPEGPPPPSTVQRVLGQQQRRCDRAEHPDGAPSLRDPAVRRLLAAVFVQFLAFNFFYAGFPIHATQRVGWSATQLGWFFAVLSGAMFVAQGPLLGALSSRLEPRAVFRLGLALLILAFATFATSSASLQFVGGVLFAAGNGIAWPTFQARTADAASSADQGAVQGAAASRGALASIVGLSIGGVVYPWLGGSLFLVGGALFLSVLAATPWLFDTPSRTGTPAG